ncbi:MAG TPA: hypothetical protein VGV38_17470, partial [Pyrinomonadaceae bacterium]|nr:hypothetical protein [Pyrinomonadaceae bacterium]
MSEDTTQGLPQANRFEERVLAELAALRTQFNTFDARLNSFDARLTSFEVRLTSLEDKVESRLHDTRPIWE